MNTRMVKRALSRMGLCREAGRLEKIYEKHRYYTMIPKATYIRNLQLASRQQAVAGCVVECGVWKGGRIAGMAEVLGAGRDVCAVRQL